MSARYVRTLTRQWLGALPQLNYYDTINRSQKPVDLIWVTAEFFADDKTGVMGCDGYTERGVIDLIFMASPGLGDDPLLSALEPAVAAFMANVDPTGHLTLESSEPLREMSSGDADAHYRLGVGVRYAFAS
jgi:hypothetical protein